MIDTPIIFWRDGYTRGHSGYWVRGVSLNKVIAKWIDEGVEVAGIAIDPGNDELVDVLIVEEEV